MPKVNIAHENSPNTVVSENSGKKITITIDLSEAPVYNATSGKTFKVASGQAKVSTPHGEVTIGINAYVQIPKAQQPLMARKFADGELS